MQTLTLGHGDCVERMAELPDSSVDAVVCDPPYGISFMQTKERTWDDLGKGAAQREWHVIWLTQAMRVLKEGGLIYAFSGSRTQHHLAAAMEKVGFLDLSVRVWCYSTGFPKNLDVSKGIDASDGVGFSKDRAYRFTEWMRTTGVSRKDINAATNTTMAGHYLTDKSQPEVATEDMFSLMRPLIAAQGVVIPAEIEEMVRHRTIESENLKRRKVVSSKMASDFKHVSPVTIAAQEGVDTSKQRVIQITEAFTEDAKNWAGYGTALKPSWEPVVCGRKP
jgi:DNA methylase